MFQIGFFIDGQLQLSRVLEGVANNVQDWTPAFEKSAGDLIDMFSNDVFDTEGMAIDEQWSPLSRAYASRKAKEYGEDTGILQATGTMKNSFTSFFDPTTLIVWNAAEYFKFHQSSLPREKIPRRVMMKLTDDLKAAVVRNFQQQFMDQTQ